MSDEALTSDEVLTLRSMLQSDYNVSSEKFDELIATAKLVTKEVKDRRERVRAHEEARQRRNNVDDNLVLEGNRLSSADIKKLFDVSAATARQRILQDGASPLLAMSASSLEYRQTHFLDKLASGWEQLCREAGQPHVETGFIQPVHLGEFGPTYGVAWVFVDDECYERDAAGARQTAYMLAAHHDTPSLVALTWIQAVTRVLYINRLYLDDGDPHTHEDTFLHRSFSLSWPGWGGNSIDTVTQRTPALTDAANILGIKPYERRLLTVEVGLYNFMKLVVQHRKEIYERRRIELQLRHPISGDTLEVALARWDKDRHSIGLSEAAKRTLVRKK